MGTGRRSSDQITTPVNNSPIRIASNQNQSANDSVCIFITHLHPTGSVEPKWSNIRSP